MYSCEIDVIRQLINNRENKNVDFKDTVPFELTRHYRPPKIALWL